jgi:SWI/SNF-related matrix-associated actin-dependent regulator of chromatin subfamily A3
MTITSQVVEIQERKKLLIQQVATFLVMQSLRRTDFLEAFSGIKRTETQRQRKEARLQGQTVLAPIPFTVLK